MPYLYKSKDHMWAVLNSEIGQKLLAGIETGVDKDGKASGLVGLCYYDAGSRSFYLTKEVHKPADLAGLKIRMQNNTMMLRMVELLGATGIGNIGPTEVLNAIQTGVVDGAENNWPTYQNNGDYNAAKFYILDQHTRVPEILLASKPWASPLTRAFHCAPASASWAPCPSRCGRAMPSTRTRSRC
jgi:TRAP-type C4-dicarboxylate transport system substrate-binding protein